MLKDILSSTSVELWISFWIVFASFIFMWYKDRLPSTGALQDLTTILNSRGGNILILAAASVYFFYRSEHMYVNVMDLVNNNKMTADNGIALNGLTFDTGAFGAAFGALLKTMSPDAPSPASSSESSTTSTTVTKNRPSTNSGNNPDSDTPSVITADSGITQLNIPQPNNTPSAAKPSSQGKEMQGKPIQTDPAHIKLQAPDSNIPTGKVWP